MVFVKVIKFLEKIYILYILGKIYLSRLQKLQNYYSFRVI
nr:MAG TPA: hypothetical protein [Caudoviricetes sp.]